MNLQPKSIAAAILASLLYLSVPSPAAEMNLDGRHSALQARNFADDADTLRTLRPADLFRVHRAGSARFSPDGRRVAFRWSRSGNEGKVDALALSQVAESRSDIWVAPVGGGQARPITDGAETGTGWFRPRWAPDGERLALLSIDGNRVTPWIWNASTDTLRQISERAVYRIGSPLIFQWRSDHELIISLRPSGVPDQGRLQVEGTRPGLFAIRRWNDAWTGDKETADVLSSGIDPTKQERPAPAEIRVIDITKDTSRTVASGRWTYGRASPDGRWLATFRHRSLNRVPQDRPLGFRDDLGSVPGVAALHGEANGGTIRRSGAPSASIPEADRAAPDAGEGGADPAGTPRHGSLRWAPDGHAFAFLTRLWGHGERPRQVAVHFDPRTGERERIGRKNRRIEALAWSGDSQLLVRARPTGGDVAGRPPAHWWRVGPDGEWDRWSVDMAETPEELYPAPGGGAVGIAEGELWRLDGESARSLTAEIEPSIRRVVWPNRPRFPVMPPAGQGRQPDGPLAVMTGAAESRQLWTIEFAEPEVVRLDRIPVPSGAAGPENVAPKRGAALFSAADSTGTWVWLSRHSPSDQGGVDTLKAADRWIADVEGGESRKLSYRGLSGRDLTAWAILPPDHREGERYPTITFVYPGAVYGDRPPMESVNVLSPWRALQIFAAEGYVVLLPSMPLRGGRRDSATRRERMDDGVLPAIQKAVQAGFVDSSRVGLLGHSYGGHGVYQLVSLTDRFDAAVASAGIADLDLAYGGFDNRASYRHQRHPLRAQRFKMYYLEGGQGGMGAPPWEAPERWRQNDPIGFVDQVETPLMMLQGDRDLTDIEGAESFFTTLYRQGKPARLIRYFGEGHVIRGRANVLDMFNRVISWFDRYLKEPVEPADTP